MRHYGTPSAFIVYCEHVDRAEHWGHRQGHEHHLRGDAAADDGGELSGWAGTAARSEVRTAFSRGTRVAARREWPGEVRGVLFVRCCVPFKLHLYRSG